MRLLIAAVLLIVFLALSATVVENDASSAAGDQNEIKVFFSADKFDAVGYVDSIWDERVVPYVRERAVDVAELRDAVRADPRAAGEKYGYRAVAEHNPYNYAVKGRIKILSANVKSKNGRIEADLFPYDGSADLTMQIGPIYKGTSIRDFLDFVSFDDFKNQVEFAKLATQLNLHVRDNVVAGLNLLEDGGVGREFDMVGAATQEADKTHFNVVPVILTPITE